MRSLPSAATSARCLPQADTTEQQQVRLPKSLSWSRGLQEEHPGSLLDLAPAKLAAPRPWA